MIFKYSGIDESGKAITEKIEATDLEEAKSKIKAKKIIYRKIKEETPSLFDSIVLFRKYYVGAKELSTLSRELAMYIRSGISIVSALKIIQNHYNNNKKMKLFLYTVSTKVDEGKDFYSALEAQDVVVLPDFYKYSIKISENSGVLDEVLLELSKFLKEQDKIKKEIAAAFAYPTFMIVVSLFVIAFMLAFVVPQITGIFLSMHQELPMTTKVVIATGDFFQHNFKFILVFIIIASISFSVMMKKSRSFAYMIHKFLLKCPYFGDIIQKSELARFSYMSSLLVRSGVPFVQTINLSANILNNLVLKKLFVNASTKVVEGKLLSNALNESDIKIDYAFIQSIALGEETSELESVLTNISELYFEENRDKISFLLTLLEPILMLVVGGSIGFIVAAMLLPIFSMSIQ